MRQLILLRHAEAQPQRAGSADFERTLTAQGRTEALDAAECLRRAAIRLDAVLVSPAVRARETALIVAAELDFNQELRYDELLYHGDAQALLSSLQHCDARATSVLLLAHNPGVSALMCHLAGGSPISRDHGALKPNGGAAPEAAREEPLALTTAGVCRVQFQADSWRSLQPDCVTAVTLLR